MNNIALVLVDIQRDFWQPLSDNEMLREFPENIKALRKYALENGIPIIHVRSIFKADRSDWMLFYKPEGRGSIPCIEGTTGVEFTDFAQPSEGEMVITKQVFDAFHGTKLVDILNKENIDAILIAGVETSVCVLFTATSAYLNRILPIVVIDACADSPSRHEKTLEMYSDLCFKTATTHQITAGPDHLNQLIKKFT